MQRLTRAWEETPRGLGKGPPARMKGNHAPNSSAIGELSPAGRDAKRHNPEGLGYSETSCLSCVENRILHRTLLWSHSFLKARLKQTQMFPKNSCPGQCFWVGIEDKTTNKDNQKTQRQGQNTQCPGIQSETKRHAKKQGSTSSS